MQVLKNLVIIAFAVASMILPTASFAAIIREDHCTLQQQTGVPLYVWRDPAVSRPRAILIAVHGSAQEAGVMETLARDLIPHGYFVVAPDVRGNGRWQTSNAPAQMADVELMESCMDVSRMLVILSRDYPGTDMFCLGESIGAGVVLKAVSWNPQLVKGVILVSAGVRPHIHNPLNMGSSFLKKMALLVEPVDLTDYVTRYCSEDPRVVKEMLNDPLAKNRQSGLDLIGTFAFLRQEPQFAAAMPSNIPVLAIQGTADQVVDPASVNELLNALQTPEKQLVIIPGCGHIIIGTSFMKPMVLACINQWLQAHESIPSEKFAGNHVRTNGEANPRWDNNLIDPGDFSQQQNQNGMSSIEHATSEKRPKN
ncbi:MAG TPA: alpha/beta fold hydrolase [Trichormus sp.]